MPKRHRHGGVKQQHSIIPGIRKKLQKIAACPYVQAVTPGRISSAVGSQQPVIVFQYFQETGMKLSGKVPGAVQEIFVVTSQPEPALSWLVAANLVLLQEERPGKAYSQRKTKPANDHFRPASEASLCTIQQYMESNSSKAGPLNVSIGDRLNGQIRQLKDIMTQQTQRGKQNTLAAHGKQSKAGQTPNSQPTTMEEWLQEADRQDTAYWQKIKSEKGS